MTTARFRDVTSSKLWGLKRRGEAVKKVGNPACGKNLDPAPGYRLGPRIINGAGCLRRGKYGILVKTGGRFLKRRDMPQGSVKE